MILAGLWISGFACVAAAAPTPAYRLETAQAQRIRAELTWHIRSPNMTAKEWIVVAPFPPELPSQSKTAAVLDPAGKAGLELSGLQRPVIAVRVPVRDKKLQQEMPVTVVYEATLHSRKLVPLKGDEPPPPVPALPRDARRTLLQATALIDHDSRPIQKWLDDAKLRRGKDESDLDLGKRVFLHLRKHWKYEFSGEMDRKASVVCTARKSDCGGLSILFVAAMRANGVPARVLCGRWAKSAKPGGEDQGGVAVFQEHVRAEFFAEGIGWVPVDPALAVNADRGDGLAYFGNDAGDFLVLHVDTELVLDSVHFGKHTLDFLQGVAHFVTGRGNLEGTEVKKAWEVKVER